jgi:hypothetical protein
VKMIRPRSLAYGASLIPKEETSKRIEHAIEVTLKTPEWMKLGPTDPVTIEHDPKGDTEESD